MMKRRRTKTTTKTILTPSRYDDDTRTKDDTETVAVDDDVRDSRYGVDLDGMDGQQTYGV
jgi:hypothetical protein